MRRSAGHKPKNSRRTRERFRADAAALIGIDRGYGAVEPSFLRPDTLAAKVYILIMDSETKQALEAMELRILERIETTETKQG